MSGELILIPTPISDYDLHHQTKELLLEQIEQKSLIVVEEAKTCRRRWLAWGLPRESIAEFEIYNEHNRDQQIDHFISILQTGRNICLMSDCGLPAFCDPGRRLVSRVHERNLDLRSAYFDNSVLLALALSGFVHESFWFAGFLPKQASERKQLYAAIDKRGETTIIMDTPYRLNKILEELNQDSKAKNWEYFLACDLLSEKELLIRGNINKLIKTNKGEKREFVAVISPKYGRK